MPAGIVEQSQAVPSSISPVQPVHSQNFIELQFTGWLESVLSSVDRAHGVLLEGEAEFHGVIGRHPMVAVIILIALGPGNEDEAIGRS